MSHNDVTERPILVEDKPPHMSLGWSKYVCGFDSLTKLKWWFDGFLSMLAEVGFLFVEYEVNSFDVEDSISRKQTFFKKDTAKIVRRIDITELFSV